MRKDIATYGGLVIVIGIALFLSSGFIAETIFNETISTLETQSISEALQEIMDASAIANTIYGLLRIIALIMIVAGVVLFSVGGALKEPNKKSFKREKGKKINVVQTPKKSKAASFIVTGWGRKNRRPKKLKLKGSKKNKRYAKPISK